MNDVALHHDVACPFCGLLCDDLSIRTTDQRLEPLTGACAKATLAFSNATTHAQPMVQGREVSLEQALRAAAELLRHSRHPLFAGLATDVAGVRASFALAERCHGAITSLHHAALAPNLRVLQTRGWQTTTLSEVRNRADLIVLVGVDLNLDFQNFIARQVAPASLQAERREQRALYYLGPSTFAPRDTCGVPLTTLSCKKEALAHLIRALQRGLTRLSTGRTTRDKALATLVTRIKGARYPVFVWAPGQLPPTQSDLIVSAIGELVAELNRSQRAAGLSLGGNDGAQTALAASAWLSGYPLGVSFQGDSIQSTPTLTAARRSADGLHDLVVFVNSFAREARPPAGLPAIVLAPPGSASANDAAVYLPVGIPGLDHVGQLMRTDAVVALPLRRLRTSGLVSAGDLLNRLHALVAAGT